jgi:uncharacterized protein (DUF2267 family)
MSTTGHPTFDTTLEKTQRLLGMIEEAYGWPHDRRQQSYAAMRAVLHALRDRLTVQEAADLAAQLPMLLRGVFYEGWNPSRVPVKMSKEEFLARVRRDFPYDVEGGIPGLVRTVLNALQSTVTQGEWDDIKSSLPKDLAVMVPANEIP